MDTMGHVFKILLFVWVAWICFTFQRMKNELLCVMIMNTTRDTLSFEVQGNIQVLTK